jgi:hypothetical protein
LIRPIQRIPRYILLLSDLAQKTRPDHPDYQNLQKAIVKITEIAEFVDTKKAFHNDSQRMVALAKCITGVPRNETLIKPSRTLLQEGELLVNKQSHNFYIILFNDALVITKPAAQNQSGSRISTRELAESYSYVNQISLIDATLTNFKGEAFSIKSALGEQFRFEASSLTLKNQWIKNIRKAIDASTALDKRKSVVAPLKAGDIPREGARRSGSGEIPKEGIRRSGSGSAIISAGGISKIK